MRLDLCVYKGRDKPRNFWVIKITFHSPPLHTHVRRSGLGPTLSMKSCVTLCKLPPRELFPGIVRSHLLPICGLQKISIKFYKLKKLQLKELNSELLWRLLLCFQRRNLTFTLTLSMWSGCFHTLRLQFCQKTKLLYFTC